MPPPTDKRGPVVLDLAERASRRASPSAFIIDYGQQISGALSDLGTSDDSRLVLAADAPLAETELLARLPRAAAILLKGSRGARLERLVAPITAWATAAT